VNIHRSRIGLTARIVLFVGAVLASGCDQSQDPGIERLQMARPAAVPPVELPRTWSAADFVQGTRLDFTFTVARADDSYEFFVTGTTLTLRASVNGRFVYESGDELSPAINYGSYRSMPSFRVPEALLRSGANQLTLELFAPAGTRFHQLGILYAGRAGSMDRLVLRRWLAFQAGPMAIGVMLVALGLGALGLWRGRRDNELFMLLAIGSLLWAFQILLNHWPTLLVPRPHISVISLSLYAWFPALIGVFFLRFAFRRTPLLEGCAAVLALVAAPMFYVAFHYGWAEEASIALRLCVLAFISIALVALLRYALQLRTLNGYTLFAMGAVCVAVAFRDFYVTTMLEESDRSLILNPYSGVALLMFAGWMLLERYHKAFAEFEMLNRDLERRVAEANVELHRRLEQVEAARATAEQANIAKSRFFAAASHDLRQPLHSLGLFASALRDFVTQDAGRALVTRIADSIDALDRLFDELLDISRLDAGTVEVRLRNVSLQPIFDRLDALFVGDAAARELRLRFVPTPLAVHTDPMLLERVLANLVSNAVRYTREGGVLVGARRRGGRVELRVCDTGVGIPVDQYELIFDEFYQIGNPGRDRRRGLGLGLAIVRRLTTLLGIKLELRSIEGRGTCFTLPLASGPSDDTRPADGPEHRLAFVDGRALIVDDDADIRDATVQLLSSWGMQAHAVGNLAEALESLDAGFEPDVILADLRLGEAVDGIGVIARLRERLACPVAALLISGDTGARELARVKESGLLLLTKPVAPAKLRSALHALLAPQR